MKVFCKLKKGQTKYERKPIQTREKNGNIRIELYYYVMYMMIKQQLSLNVAHRCSSTKYDENTKFRLHKGKAYVTTIVYNNS